MECVSKHAFRACKQGIKEETTSTAKGKCVGCWLLQDTPVLSPATCSRA